MDRFPNGDPALAGITTERLREELKRREREENANGNENNSSRETQWPTAYPETEESV